MLVFVLYVYHIRLGGTLCYEPWDVKKRIDLTIITQAR